MKVIWKRPDGFQGAHPSDYEAVELSTYSKIWLHKTDKKNFPFRISGGWQDETASEKLNYLVNLLPSTQDKWHEHLVSLHNHSEVEDESIFLEELCKWLKELRLNLKGDTWEMAIMDETICEVLARIETTSKK